MLQAMQCERVGTACVILGGGRERKEDSVDPAVGFVLHKKVGDAVSSGESLCTVHYNSDALARGRKFARKLHDRRRTAFTKRPLVHRVIGKSGEKK